MDSLKEITIALALSRRLPLGNSGTTVGAVLSELPPPPPPPPPQAYTPITAAERNQKNKDLGFDGLFPVFISYPSLETDGPKINLLIIRVYAPETGAG